MKLFGGGHDSGDANDSPETRRQRRRAQLDQAREDQYLRSLTEALESPRPSHETFARKDGQAPPPRQSPPPPPAPDPTPAPAQPEPETLAPVGASSEDPFVQLASEDLSAAGDFSFGDILILHDDTVGIFNRHIPEKEYDVVHTLQDDGSLDPKGIPLEAHSPRVIGRLPAAATRELTRVNRWERDLIVFHLYEYPDTQLIPHPRAAAPDRGAIKHQPAQEVEKEFKSPLIRGRRFKVNFGDREWEAVYWGHDEQGALVAHITTGKWSLMHLDLKRFEGSIEYGELLKPEVLAKVETQLLSASGEAG